MFLEDYIKIELTMKSKLAKYCPCCQTRLVQKAASQMESDRLRDGKSCEFPGEGHAAIETGDSKVAVRAKKMAKTELTSNAKKNLEARKRSKKVQRSQKCVCDDSDRSAEDDAHVAPPGVESCCSFGKARGGRTSRRNPAKSKEVGC